MRMYCLSSITKIPIQPPLIIPIPYEKGSDELCLNTINASLTPSNLTKFFSNPNSSAYKLTEICIGHEEVEFHENEHPKKIYVMKVYQTNTKLLTFKMIRGAVKPLKNKPENDKEYIDEFFLSTSKLWPNEISSDQVDYDIKIKIRCIKNTSDKGLITPEAELAYNNFGKEIQNFCNSEITKNPDLLMDSIQEEAFEQLPLLKLPNTTEIKPLQDKIRNFQSAIDLLCNPATGQYKNVPLNFKDTITNKNVICRFNQKAECLLEQKESHWYVKNPRSSLYSKTNEFRDCTKLIWEKISSPKLNNEKDSEKIKFDDDEFLKRFNDFDFQKLTNVHLKNVDLFLSKTFVHPILKRMNFQTISFMVLDNCKITGLNDEFFEFLSSFEGWLEFPNNDITFISDKISKIIKLKGLNLNNNKNLSILPWNYLPSNIEKLELDGTNITQIPAEIEMLILLKEFQASSDQLEYISWKSFSPKIQVINVKGGGKTVNDIELKDKEKLFVLSVVNLKLQRVDPSNLPPNLFTLNLSENKLEYFDTSKLKDQLPDLDKLCISKNKLKFISWKDLPEDLSVMDLSENLLTSIEDPQMSEISLENLMVESLNISSPTTIDRILPNVKQILLDKNELTYLPKNFENLNRLRYLGLSKNHFKWDSEENGNIHEKLWNRLPKKFSILRLSGNNLGFIPCCIKKFEIEKLFVDDCHLHHICPYLHTKFQNDGKQRIPDGKHMTINISGNFLKLKNLSFIPSKIYLMPNSKEKSILETSHKQIIDASEFPTTILICTNKKKDENYRDTTKVKYTKNVYEFDKPKTNNRNQDSNNQICDCCASCGQKSENSPIFEQYMVMDSILQIQEEPPIYFELGKWKTKIKSRLCDFCMKEFKKKIDQAYEEFNKEKSSSKKKKTEIINEDNILNLEEEPLPLPRRGRPPKPKLPQMESEIETRRPRARERPPNKSKLLFQKELNNQFLDEEELENESNNQSLMDYEPGPSNAFPPIEEVLYPSKIIIIDQNETEVASFDRVPFPSMTEESTVSNDSNEIRLNNQLEIQNPESGSNYFEPNFSNFENTEINQSSEFNPTAHFPSSLYPIQNESTTNYNPSNYVEEENFIPNINEFSETQQNAAQMNQGPAVVNYNFDPNNPNHLQYYYEQSHLHINEDSTSNNINEQN